MSPKAMFGFLEILLFLEPFTILLLHCPTELRHIAAESNMSCLDSFAKLRKATSSFVTSVCLSVHLCVQVEQLRSHCQDFSEI